MSKSTRLLLIFGVLVWLCLAAVTFLGPRFEYEVFNRDRPIRWVTGLYVLASLISLAAVVMVLRTRQWSTESMRIMIGFAIAFRLVQLLAPPFQEIDLYRYMWDGIVVSSGESPYRVSPEKAYGQISPDPEVRRIQEIAARSKTTRLIVTRIHFEQYTTIYPPVSQFLFGLAMWPIPPSSSLSVYLFAIKLVITLFDLATFCLVILLVKRQRLHPGWAMLYGWNVTVIKEFSNSGHLDSFAVFFVALAVYLSLGPSKVHSGQQHSASRSRPDPNRPSRSQIRLVGSAACIGLGVGCKIFPIILLPLLLVYHGATSSWKAATGYLATAVLVSLVAFGPMLMEIRRNRDAKGVAAETENVESRSVVTESLDPGTALQANDGLTTFLRRWQINELVFMIFYQNLREVADDQVRDRPWFRVLPDPARSHLNSSIAFWVDRSEAPMVMARLITTAIFGLGYAFVIWRFVCVEDKQSGLLESAFWVIAIFFCLQPTQNPWYWTWAVPFLPFVKNRVWTLYSTFLFAYYLRFWFRTLDGTFEFAGQTYSGGGLFDYVIVWLEHGIIYLMVMGWQIGLWIRKTRSARNPASLDSAEPNGSSPKTPSEDHSRG